MTINEVRVASRRYWSTCSLTRLFIRCRTKTKLKFPRNLIFLKINHSYPACYFSDSTRRPMQCLMQALRPFQTFVIFVTVGHMCDFKQLEFSQTTRFLVASASCGKHPWHCYSFPFCDRDICTCGGLGFRPATACLLSLFASGERLVDWRSDFPQSWWWCDYRLRLY